MRNVNFLIMLLLFIIIISFELPGCTLRDEDIVEGKGTIIYLTFEGGFYGIVADNGEHYDPINLPSEFEEDSLKVKFKGKKRDDLMSTHMWGQLIELIYIKKLQ